jgi:hypothetical protein
MFDANPAPILHQEKHYPQTDRTELPLELSPRSRIEFVQNNFHAYGMFGANRAPTLGVPWVRLKRFMSLWYV